MKSIALAAPGRGDSAVVDERLLKGVERLLVAPLLHKYKALVVPGLCQRGIDAKCCFKGAQSLCRTTQCAEDCSLAIPCSGIVRLQLYCLFKCFKSLARAPEGTERCPLAIPRGDKRRVQLQGAFERRKSFLVPRTQALCQAAPLPAKRAVTVDLQRLIINGHSFVQAFLRVQGVRFFEQVASSRGQGDRSAF